MEKQTPDPKANRRPARAEGAGTELAPTNSASAPSTSSKLKISGVIFEVADVYAAGHPLTENEAAVLNQTRRENLRNNFNKTVEAAQAKAKEARGSEDLTAGELKDLAAAFQSYVGEYVFGVRKAAAVSVDPVEREARKIARLAIEAKLRELKREKPAKEAMEELISKLVAAKPEITETAKRRVAELQAAGGFDIDSLGVA